VLFMDDTNIDTEGNLGHDKWLSMAKDAYESSTEWFDTSVRRTVEKAMAHFSNHHAPGSKYYADSYKYRSKGFRPKTRATIRRNEAASAVAFFSTQDMVAVTAESQSNKEQVLSAAVLGELLNYRLTDSIPWFQTMIGAYQNAMNTGVVISHQSWEFEEESQDFPMVDELGQPTGAMQTMRRTLSDKPRIDLVAIENFRISPASDWTNPVGTSPYVVELIPMFIGVVKEKMAAGKWLSYDSGKIQTAVTEQYDSIRAARDGKKRLDGVDVTHATTDFDTVFVHRNIIRKDGKDMIFYTLGTHLMLTEPKLLTEEYAHLKRGERPYVMGTCIIETHKMYPAGPNELLFGLQENANEIANQRQDNVALVMNKRYFAKRTATIDFKSLTRNVPGSVTLVDDINSDIRWDSPPDVTSSSYQEQDRVSLDFDELAGTFSPGTVQSNRAMNETVGGMNMLSADANTLTEYQLRVFAETWAEPVLKQTVRMEQAYETDELVMAIAGDRAKALQRFGVDMVTDEMLQGTVTVNVNIGFGATNPQKRIEKLVMGMQAIAGLSPATMQGLDAKEAVGEILGALGYKSAERFFPKLGEEQQAPQQAPPDPRIEVARMNNEARTQIAKGAADSNERVVIENNRHREQVAASTFANEEFIVGVNNENADQDRALRQEEITGKLANEVDKLKAQLAIKTMELQTQRELALRNEATAVPQVAATSFEPYGRAPNGQAFQQ